MYILGISAFYHDSAAAIISDGVVRAAAAEERFSRKKHDNSFPAQAIAFCLKEAGISITDVDTIAYYERPLRKFERILDTSTRTYPRSLGMFVNAMPGWLSTKIRVEKIIRDTTGYTGDVLFVPHHLSHAAMAFFPSPYTEAAILTVDGVGEYQTTALWYGTGTEIRRIASLDFPHSLGLLYSTITAFLGFRVNDEEYKVMGLAGYGNPTLLKPLSQTIEVKGDGSFKLNLAYFSFRESSHMWSRSLEGLLGAPRRPGSEITQRHKDIAASIQSLTEDVYFKMLNHLHAKTRSMHLCIGGGVALNARANGKIFEATAFSDAYIVGAAGDDGAAIGAALYAHHQKALQRTPLRTLSLGTSYDSDAIEAQLKKSGLPYTRCDSKNELAQCTAKLISEGKIVGWYQGNMEFGPRALGNRSILADPRNAHTKDVMNRVKGREGFHPFACSILEERAAEYFDIPSHRTDYSFMTFCVRVKQSARNLIPAVLHIDDTCRIQTVSTVHDPYYSLIKAFEDLTQIPCVLNTSFNRRGEPIVETPEQAVADFAAMEIDALAIGTFIVVK